MTDIILETRKRYRVTYDLVSNSDGAINFPVTKEGFHPENIRIHFYPFRKLIAVKFLRFIGFHSIENRFFTWRLF
jgi:hypothetical protein